MRTEYEYDDGLAPGRGCMIAVVFGVIFWLVFTSPWWVPQLMLRVMGIP
jgi:hypothetical protein